MSFCYYLSELPFGRIPADKRRKGGQQEHDDGQQDEFGAVQEHAALPVVFDLVERGHSFRYVVAPVPGLHRRHPQRLAVVPGTAVANSNTNNGEGLIVFRGFFFTNTRLFN